MDKYGFKVLMTLITLIEIFVAGSIYILMINEIIYYLYIVLILICIAGTFSILAPEFNKIFGLISGPECYGLTAIWIGLANILGPLLTKFVIKNMKSYFIILIIGGAFCVIKLILVICFTDVKYIKSKLSSSKNVKTNDFSF